MFKVEIKKKNSSYKTLSLHFCWPLITFLVFLYGTGTRFKQRIMGVSGFCVAFAIVTWLKCGSVFGQQKGLSKFETDWRYRSML